MKQLFYALLVIALPGSVVCGSDNEKKAHCQAGSIYCEISIGELIDKITILQIKAEKIKDAQKLAHVKNELASLQKTLKEKIPATAELEKLTNQLKEINAKLWRIEDDIRDKERHKRFDTEFIELARAVYFTNDERARVKRAINDLLGSHIIEEKDYASYTQPIAGS